MTAVVRAARLEDCEIILDFIRALAEYEKLSAMVEADAARISRSLFGPDPKAFCSIAEWDSKPAGFALWFYTYSTFLARPGIWLEDLFVQPDARGKGIGNALLTDLARRCVAEELGRLEWAVLDWNEPSIRFYRSLGAVRMNDWQIFRLAGPELNRLGSDLA